MIKLSKAIEKPARLLSIPIPVLKFFFSLTRDEEIAEITEVLAKRNKSNVLMVGDPGVGKTAIAEGLARNIHEKKVAVRAVS